MCIANVDIVKLPLKEVMRNKEGRIGFIPYTPPPPYIFKVIYYMDKDPENWGWQKFSEYLSSLESLF